MIVNMSGGGGSTEIFAVIAGTYPEGSICTATNGTEFLTAPNTNGSVIFAIPKPKTLPETWTVTATDGTNSKSQSVSITTEGQFENVELSYRQYLYKSGDECADITGGWTGLTEAVGTFTKYNDHIDIGRSSTTGASGVSASTKNKIDVTNFNTLYVDALIDTSGGNSAWIAGLSSKPSASSAWDYPQGETHNIIAATTVKTDTDRAVTSLDISKITGEHYVEIAIVMGYSHIFNVYLE